MNIKGKRVLVSGASSGIGAATAKAMAAGGAAEVILLARSVARLNDGAAQIAAMGVKARVYPVDLSDPVQVTAVAARVIADTGAPEILINCAGSGQWKFLDETGPEEVRAMMTLPYFAAAWLTQAFLPSMRRAGSGHIVNITSIASRFVWPGATAYIAARCAMRGFTEALRADLHRTGITVTLFESGEVETDYWRNNPDSRRRIPSIGKMVPVLTAETVANAIVNGVRRDRQTIVVPLMMRAVCLMHAVMPQVVQALMTGTGARPKPVGGRVEADKR